MGEIWEGKEEGVCWGGEMMGKVWDVVEEG